MNANRSGKLLIFLVLIMAASGCAHVVSWEMREKAAKDLPFGAVLSNPEKYKGEIVIWGGLIIDSVNEADGTSTIKVLETSLDSYGLPDDDEYSKGRFLAKVPRYLDKEIYKNGRKITLAGEVMGKEVLPLGEAQYTYPVISVKEIHLWKPVPYYYGPYPYDYWYWGGAPYPYYLPMYRYHYFHHH